MVARTVKQLVERDARIPLEVDDSILLIKSYVKARKGVDINPIITTAGHLITALRMAIQAIMWFKEHPDKIDSDG